MIFKLRNSMATLIYFDELQAPEQQTDSNLQDSKYRTHILVFFTTHCLKQLSCFWIGLFLLLCRRFLLFQSGILVLFPLFCTLFHYVIYGNY